MRLLGPPRGSAKKTRPRALWETSRLHPLKGKFKGEVTQGRYAGFSLKQAAATAATVAG